jgi:hypothetical protein
MILKERAGHRQQRKGRAMPALMEAQKVPGCGNPSIGLGQESLDELILAMGKRLQTEYVEGAIPFLREHEMELWAQLEALDQEESLEALLAYERLFFEGLRRYVSHLEVRRQAA